MSRLYIAEKPSLAETVATAIGNAKRSGGYWICGNGDKVVPLRGHQMEQAPPEAYDERLKDWALAYLPQIPPLDGWRKYVKKDCKERVELVRKLMADASEVVNLGDADREGNLLVDEVIEALKYKGPVKRLWFMSQDGDSVRKAIASMKPNSEYRGYTAAAEGRARADWMIGMNLTMAFTIAWRDRGNSGAVHTGRVQTPTLWMVVTRDLEIENFKPVDYFLAKFQFMHEKGAFWVTWKPREGTASMDDQGRIIDRRQAADLVERIGGAMGNVAKLETKRHAVKPPLPWNLSELQKEAHRRFGYAPEKTLELAQSLYDVHKLTTYPRSPMRFLPESMFPEAPGVVEAVKKVMGNAFDFEADIDLSRRSPAWDDSKVNVDGNSHFGIVPNGNSGDFSALSNDEKNIYRLIVRNYLAQFCPDYVYDGTTVLVEAGDDREQFAASGKVVVAPGWKKLFGAAAEEKAGADGDQKLPDMRQGDSGEMSNGKVDAKKTEPPPRFNGASLIDAMENAHRYIEDADVRKRLNITAEDLAEEVSESEGFNPKALLKKKGIGTEATRSNIIKNLLSREYLQEVGKGTKSYYLSTAKGRALIASLPDVLKKPDLTAFFEDMMQQVQEGKLSLDEFTNKQARFVTRIVDEVKSGEALVNMPRDLVTGKGAKSGGGQPAAAHACIEPGCSGTMKRRQRKGDKKFFWVCENEHFADDKAGAPVTRERATAVKPCPACGAGQLFERKGKQGKFLGCDSYPKCNYTEEVAA